MRYKIKLLCDSKKKAMAVIDMVFALEHNAYLLKKEIKFLIRPSFSITYI